MWVDKVRYTWDDHWLENHETDSLFQQLPMVIWRPGILINPHVSNVILLFMIKSFIFSILFGFLIIVLFLFFFCFVYESSH